MIADIFMNKIYSTHPRYIYDNDSFEPDDISS